jgi:hypothetical protein
MKVSQLYPSLVIPSASDVFVASAIAQRVSWACDAAQRAMQSQDAGVDARKADKDAKRLARIAARISKASLELDRAACELSA